MIADTATAPSMLEKASQAPAILDHLVIGINETIKSLERAIDDLKFRMMIISDTLNGTLQSGRAALPVSSNGLLPTAPEQNISPASGTPLGFIVIPLLSISPQSLVTPIPQYCATYNALVHQWGQLKKVVETRLKKDDWGVLGEAREEVRVVPLGDVELELARMVGLRRAACIGIRVRSFPSASADTLDDPSGRRNLAQSTAKDHTPTAEAQDHAAVSDVESTSPQQARQTLSPRPRGPLRPAHDQRHYDHCTCRRAGQKGTKTRRGPGEAETGQRSQADRAVETAQSELGGSETEAGRHFDRNHGKA